MTDRQHRPGAHTQRQLINKAINGDAKAFGELYEEYVDAIYRYIYFRVGSEVEAEDLTDEVFVRAWEALPEFRPSASYSFSAWLYRIAHNLVVDSYRRRSPVTFSRDELDKNKTRLPSVEEEAQIRHEAANLVKAVQHLSDTEQDVIVLRFVEGLSHREVAQVIGKSESASRVIQHRALAALRKILVRQERHEE
ncbi:MAG: sigma-70 family RNA polymerase sigma factor [Candidatus Promineifilaceae bacterium]|nr:sigma-70 family RNA polymerase sigma factor [Candidatus Promineifilaceae bacterium]